MYFCGVEIQRLLGAAIQNSSYRLRDERPGRPASASVEYNGRLSKGVFSESGLRVAFLFNDFVNIFAINIIFVKKLKNILPF